VTAFPVLQVVVDGVDPKAVERAALHEACRRVLAMRVAAAHKAVERAMDAHADAERARLDLVAATDLLLEASKLVDPVRA
jgi:hypothetical protein